MFLNPLIHFYLPFVEDVPMKKKKMSPGLPSEHFEISVQNPPMDEKVKTLTFLRYHIKKNP